VEPRAGVESELIDAYGIAPDHVRLAYCRERRDAT
jgi:hypothetical protein